MFRGMWVDSRSALKGLGANLYPRCCDFATTAVDASNQAYDSRGYCTIPPEQGGTLGTCSSEIIPGIPDMLLLGGFGIFLFFFLGMSKR
jgi:hypothetical protein